jgi:pyruvate formate lyase activating enzyme
MAEEIRGTVFNIQRYSIHDGPGIRTVVFLKGCPLRCRWCCNPESWSAMPETWKNAVGEEEAIGKTFSLEEVLEEVKKDRNYFRHSGGGITLSGGEALMQPEFSAKILQLCYDANIHTAIETSGYGPWSALEPVAEYTDLFLYDIKHMNPITHEALTGVSNTLILGNLTKLIKRNKQIIVRVPFLPEYNGSEENLTELAQFMKQNRLPEIHLMPFHQLGKDKYRKLGKAYQLKDILPLKLREDGAKKLADAKLLLEEFGLQVIIGG